jgi:DNA-binding protein HU-beta
MRKRRIKKMNKAELVSKVAEKLGYTKKDTTAVVDTVFDVIKEGMVLGEEVSISGFGKFTVSERAAREGRNPQSGEKISIPASKAPKFRASKVLKDAVNA